MEIYCDSRLGKLLDALNDGIYMRKTSAEK